MTNEQIEYEYQMLSDRLNDLCSKKLEAMRTGQSTILIQEEIDMCMGMMKELRDEYGL